MDDSTWNNLIYSTTNPAPAKLADGRTVSFARGAGAGVRDAKRTFSRINNENMPNWFGGG